MTLHKYDTIRIAYLSIFKRVYWRENPLPNSVFSNFGKRAPIQLKHGERAQSRIEDDALNAASGFSPIGVFLITLLGIALAEIVAMIAVYFVPQWPYVQQVLLDVLIMSIIIFPVLYFLSLKPLLRQIEYRNQSEQILLARLALIEFANAHPLEQILQFALDQVESLTYSAVSFLYILEEDDANPGRLVWSTQTLRNLRQADTLVPYHPNLGQTPLWDKALRSCQPLIINGYAALPPAQKLPQPQLDITRLLIIPLIRSENAVAILHVGNKSTDYTPADTNLVSTFIDFAWDIIRQSEAEKKLIESEEKFRTLADWTYDWENWIDPHGQIVYTSPSCEALTGYTPAQLIAAPQLLVDIIHPDDREAFIEHSRAIHDAQKGPYRVEYRIVSRSGEVYWIEHHCRPLFSEAGKYLGRRISNRDITPRKLAQQEIIRKSRNEVVLTRTLHTIQNDIARDLHDTLGQNISYLRMTLQYLAEVETLSLESVKTQVNNMSKAANESYELIRAMLAVLQLKESAEVLHLFQVYAEQVAQRSNLSIQVSGVGEARPLSTQQIQQLFFIFREGLSNIEKYAGSCQVQAQLIWEEAAFTFRLADNGNGFELNSQPARNHYGLVFMRQRVEMLHGDLLIETAPSKGTVITITAPYEVEAANQVGAEA